MYYIFILIFIIIFSYFILLNCKMYYDMYNTQSLNMSHIYKNIYISSYYSANNHELLSQYKINHVLSVIPNNIKLGIKMTNYPGVKYVQINIEDEYNAEISKYFDYTYNIIDNAIKKNENILVHCYSGKSRSVTIVTAYLMKKLNITRDQALSIIKKNRPIANPNMGFMIQLLEYESH